MCLDYFYLVVDTKRFSNMGGHSNIHNQRNATEGLYITRYPGMTRIHVHECHTWINANLNLALIPAFQNTISVKKMPNAFMHQAITQTWVDPDLRHQKVSIGPNEFKAKYFPYRHQDHTNRRMNSQNRIGQSQRLGIKPLPDLILLVLIHEKSKLDEVLAWCHQAILPYKLIPYCPY